MAFVYGDPFVQLQDELERMLGAFGQSEGGQSGGVFPPVNVFDAGDAYVVKAELPGVAPEKIDVTVEDDVLIVRGERAATSAGTEGAYHRRERTDGRFRRVVRVPGRVAADEAHAEYRDGVLTVRVAKAKERIPQRVQIKAA